ncbi:MAG: mucin desulfatase, partial [Candidatus Promineifilaceae bacterium]
MDQVRLRLEIFEPLARGYMSAAGSFLTPQELEGLVLSSQVIVFEIGMRFLSDYLEGDVYFKTERPNHNLDRCRTQFRLLESIEQQREPMERILESLA